MESLGTEYLSTKEKIGNYAPFSDVLISTGHDPASDQKLSADARLANGFGERLCYSIGRHRISDESISAVTRTMWLLSNYGVDSEDSSTVKIESDD